MRPKAVEVLGLTWLRELALDVRLTRDFGSSSPKPRTFLPRRRHDFFEADKGTAADEEDVLRVHLDVLLLRMLAPALRRHVADRALDDLEQRLLHAFAGHVAGDADVLGLAADLVDLVDVDDADLGALRRRSRRLGEGGG
jgi:hypothetical protein